MLINNDHFLVVVLYLKFLKDIYILKVVFDKVLFDDEYFKSSF